MYNYNKKVNLAIDKCKTKLFTVCSSDYIFNNNFIENLSESIQYVNMEKNVYHINVFEKDMGMRNKKKLRKYTPCGYMRIYSTNRLKNIKGFNPLMMGRGYNHTDVMNRLYNLFKVTKFYSLEFTPKLFILHDSHSDKSRVEDCTPYNKRISNLLYNYNTNSIKDFKNMTVQKYSDLHPTEK